MCVVGFGVWGGGGVGAYDFATRRFLKHWMEKCEIISMFTITVSSYLLCFSFFFFFTDTNIAK